jgi:O-antigen ligase
VSRKATSRVTAKRGASGKPGGPSAAAGARRRRSRQRYPALAAPAGVELAALPGLALAALALVTPLVFWTALRDEVVLPKLIASFAFTGIALALTGAAGLWGHVDWRACRLPLGLLGAFLAAAAVATADGIDPVRSLLGETTRYQGLVPLLIYALLLLAAIGAAAGGGARFVLAGMFAGGVASAAYGLLQRLGADPYEWFGLPPGRIGATFAQPNALGIEIVVAGTAGLALWNRAARRWRLAVGAGLGLLALVLLFTLSRGAWVGAVAAAIVSGALFVRRLPTRRQVALAAGALAAATAIFVALPEGRDFIGDVGERARTVTDLGETSNSQRLGLWRMAMDMLVDRPVLGLGPDGFSQRFARYRDADQPGFGTLNVRPESTHNLFLDVAVGTGVAGLTAWLAFLGSVAWVAWRALPGLDEPRRRDTGVMLAALAGYYAAVFFSFADGMTGWIPWLLSGLVLGTIASRPVALAPWRREVWPRWLAPSAVASYAGAFVALVFGLMLLVADWSAGQAQDAARTGDIQRAIDLGRVAVRWNPLQPEYYLDLGTNLQNAGVFLGRAYLEDAVDIYETVNSRFEPTASSLIQEAQARARLTNMERAEDRERVFALLERAVVLDPYNADIRKGVIEFYELAKEPERAAPHREALARFAPEEAPEPGP